MSTEVILLSLLLVVNLYAAFNFIKAMNFVCEALLNIYKILRGDDESFV